MQKQVEYSDAIKTKYPEQVVIAIAKDRNGKFNPITLGWITTANVPKEKTIKAISMPVLRPRVSLIEARNGLRIPTMDCPAIIRVINSSSMPSSLIRMGW